MSSLIKTVKVSEVARPLPRGSRAAADSHGSTSRSAERAPKESPVPVAQRSESQAVTPQVASSMVAPPSAPAFSAAAAAEDLVRRRREAEQEGYQQGLSRGKAESERTREAQKQRFDELLAAIEAERNRYLNRLEDGVPEVVMEAMARLLGRALASPAGTIASIREIIQTHCASQSSLVVRIAPSDFAFLGEAGVAAIGAGLRSSIQVESDERVQLGGCLIETPAGNLDARLEVQLERLKQAILDARRVAEPAEHHAAV